jgi:hypothetical protein
MSGGVEEGTAEERRATYRDYSHQNDLRTDCSGRQRPRVVIEETVDGVSLAEHDDEASGDDQARSRVKKEGRGKESRIAGRGSREEIGGRKAGTVSTTLDLSAQRTMTRHATLCEFVTLGTIIQLWSTRLSARYIYQYQASSMPAYYRSQSLVLRSTSRHTHPNA